MQIIFFSSSLAIVDEWRSKHDIEYSLSCYDVESLYEKVNSLDNYIIIADYDTVANDINKMLSSNRLLENLVVLEKIPEIITGKMLISKGVKAYGNSRMATIHYLQMLQTILDKKVWTYPELTASLSKSKNSKLISNEALKLIENRLSLKEKEVLFCILDGFTNSAISSKLDITTRTVKAHVSSIFSKLHINDRVGLILLLKHSI